MNSEIEEGKFGFVTIVGKPNAGKSTLINQIIQKKVSIATHRKNTTRNQIRAVYNDKESQIIFIDTPGFLKSKSLLDESMKEKIINSFNGVDIILFLIPFWKEFDNEYLNKIKFINQKTKKIALITQIDKSKNPKEIFEKGIEIEKSKIFDEIIPISSTHNKNIDTLISVIKKYLEKGIYHYGREDIFDVSEQFYVSEIIREKILIHFHFEIPHNVFVKTIEIKEYPKNCVINSEIILNKDNQKKILIGQDGEMIKKIKYFSEQELSKYFDKKVELNIFIKVRKNWINKESIIKEI